MTGADAIPRIVRYGELVPCRSAFIDAHTPPVTGTGDPAGPTRALMQ